MLEARKYAESHNTDPKRQICRVSVQTPGQQNAAVDIKGLL